jgi:hypothetical protein
MEKTLEDAVVTAIGSPDLQEGLAELGEVGLDHIMSDGVLRDVPILGTLLNTVRAAGHVRDALFVRKLARFFQALDKVPFEQRQAFCASLGSTTERRRVGEALLLLLDRLDDMSKPELVARAFRAYMRGEIDRRQFELLASAIDRCHLSHLHTLEQFYSEPDQRVDSGSANIEAYQEFAFIGLARLHVGSNGGGWFSPKMAGGSGTYVQNQLGRLFVEILKRDV